MANVLKIDSYNLTVTASTDITAPSGKVWRYAREVVLKALDGNANDILVGGRDRQVYKLSGGEEIKLSSILNRQSQSARFDLQEIWVDSGAGSLGVDVLLIEPTDD